MTLDADDLARIATVEGQQLAIRLEALGRVTMPVASPDKRLLRYLRGRDPMAATDAQREQVERLMWKYRRQLPSHLVPKVNPADPVVRQMRAAERAADGLA